jgi:Transposase DDE domain
VAKEARAALLADRGYFNGEEILACEQAGITVTLPKPMTSGAKSEGRFGKQDFVYSADEDVYRCPAGEKLTYRFTAEEHGQKLRRYWTDACRTCPIKAQCTTGKQRRITRWEHEEVVEAVQQRLDKNPDAMRTRRETVEHPFGTMKMRMGATHFLTKTLQKVATEDGSLCADLQSYTCTEHRRHQAADGGNPSIGESCHPRFSRRIDA